MLTLSRLVEVVRVEVQLDAAESLHRFGADRGDSILVLQDPFDNERISEFCVRDLLSAVFVLVPARE